jgi:hypothetical protein
MDLVSRPLERRWNERTLREAQGRMQGQDFLVPFGGAGHPGDCQKELAQQGETKPSSNSLNAHESKTFIQHTQSCQSDIEPLFMVMAARAPGAQLGAAVSLTSQPLITMRMMVSAAAS